MPWLDFSKSNCCSNNMGPHLNGISNKTSLNISPYNIGSNSHMDGGGNMKVVTLPIGPLPHNVIFALDVGGSLAKVVYVPQNNRNESSRDVNLHMVTYDTDKLEECLDYIKQHVIGFRNSHMIRVPATGVGCMKYRERISQALHVELNSDCDEMDHALSGLNFLWQHLPPDKLLHEESDITDLSFKCPLGQSGLTPCLLVNLGSALTIVQINEDGSMKGIVGGSTQGGLTFLGLGALLTQAKSFEDLVDMAEKGDRCKLDLLVKDTAGDAYNLMPSDGMVSSFGKAAKSTSNSQGSKRFKEEDVASSLLYLITDQLAQTTYLVAKSQGIHRAVFCGSFLSNNHSILQHIKNKLDMCFGFLQHSVQAVFCNYENYLGAIGTFASQLEQTSSSLSSLSCPNPAVSSPSSHATSSNNNNSHHKSSSSSNNTAVAAAAKTPILLPSQTHPPNSLMATTARTNHNHVKS